MEVRFNGKKIAISGVTMAIFESMLDNAAKNINKYSNQLSKVFEDAYRVVLTSRLGKRGHNNYDGAGIATGKLKQSIKIQKQSVSFIRQSKTSGVIKIKNKPSFNKYGYYIGLPEDESWGSMSGGGYSSLVNNLEKWIKNKKNGSFYFDRDWKRKVKNKERALARLIAFRWTQGQRRHVLPKWYDVFKDGNKEALDALYSNKTKLENSIKKILNG
jgi:hypothetical protein